MLLKFDEVNSGDIFEIIKGSATMAFIENRTKEQDDNYQFFKVLRKGTTVTIESKSRGYSQRYGAGTKKVHFMKGGTMCNAKWGDFRRCTQRL